MEQEVAGSRPANCTTPSSHPLAIASHCPTGEPVADIQVAGGRGGVIGFGRGEVQNRHLGLHVGVDPTVDVGGA